MTDTTTSPPRSHRRRWIVGALATLTAAVVGIVAWIFVAADARSNIVAVPQSLTCGSTKTESKIVVPDDPLSDGVPKQVFEFSAGPGTICNLTVVVANTGSRPVRIHTMEFPGMAPAPTAGHMIVVSRDIGSDAEARDHDGDRTAVFDIDETLGGGETSTWQLEVTHNASTSTCHDSSYSEHHDGLPIVTTSALGLGGTTTGSVNLIAHGADHAGPDCG